MDRVEYLVIGAGVSGLSFANWLRAEARERTREAPDIQVLEADSEPGGYCKTIRQDGFVWDYSGHFFHFKDAALEAWLRARMPGEDIRTVAKRTFIRYAGRDVDFPFQKNIHQLPQQDFIDCLVDLYFRDRNSAPASGAERSGEGASRPAALDADRVETSRRALPRGESATGSRPRSFQEMLYARFGRGIADKFLIPYNEKLYACDLDTLDPDAMGRFFPHADIGDIIANMRRPDNASYNATFTYPRGGAIQYIHALLRDLPGDCVRYGERLEAIDLRAQVAHTSRRSIQFRRLVSSAPFPALLRMSGLAYDAASFTWNKVLVFNLGFDRKGAAEPHWIYFPERALSFYRVGFYDNIMGDERMSLYVEIGADRHRQLDVEAARERVLRELAEVGIIGDHRLASWHSVTLDPAYVHITAASREAHQRLSAVLNAAGVYPVGRYGGWTYCSIEDNMLETQALARRFAPLL
ncbi:protoporphyrinogen/coproporphyrinogen oxidase [Haliangium ochraceum]|uniref:Protoporphyrinogen oxidase-like protein n=1 Tax=Haliangium ochraceum (strain DSM 14365 / JCM 11303 / SMP-2) TaxID=502025 RepID=D0LJM4_HALO1|nr:FAD-dependent oxidoreductase [Haliangium ochraceum]ACY16598.1 Protoporphyrinogen oxidase-like protein [Haliangium ochraceum DSM 14365]